MSPLGGKGYKTQYMYRYRHIVIHIHTHTHRYIHPYIYTYVHIHIHIRIHIHIHIHIHIVAGGFWAVILSRAVWNRNWAGRDPTHSIIVADRSVAIAGDTAWAQLLTA